MDVNAMKFERVQMFSLLLTTQVSDDTLLYVEESSPFLKSSSLSKKEERQ